MKLTKAQLSELLDCVNRINEENANGTDSMQRSSFATTLGVALMRSLRYGPGSWTSTQAETLHDEWEASAPRYDFSGK